MRHKQKVNPRYAALLIASGLSSLMVTQAFAENDGPTYDGMLNGAKGVVAPPPAPATRGGLSFKIESVYVKPGFSEKDSAYVAQIEDEVAKDIDFDHEFDFSQRYEVGYLAPTSKLGWRARTWYYDTGSDASNPFADDDNGLIADDAITVAVGGARVEDIDTLTVEPYELEMWITDLEVTYQQSECLQYSAGIRIAKIDQSYGLGSDEGTLGSDIDYLGFGPTVEVSYNKVFSEGSYGQFSFFAKARASALWGDHEIDSYTSDYDSYSDDETRFVYSLEAAAGVIWRPQTNGNDNFYVTAGVEYQYWANVGNTFNTYGDVTDDSPGPIPIDSDMEDGDIDLFGFTLGLGWDF